MRIGIDLDGVCYNFSASVREYLRGAAQSYGDGEYPDPTRWEFYEDWGLNLSQFLDVCHEGVDAGVIFTHGEPYPHVTEAFMRIKAAGHSIHIVTDRSFGTGGASEGATRAWLDKHDLPFDSLTFTSDKTVVNLDAMVDDKPANYYALTEAGVPTWLLTRTWNQKHTDITRRVLDLLHYAEVVA